MAGSSFGLLFRVTTAGESHGPANVVIVDGVPAGLPLGLDDLRPDLARRRPGQSHLTTQRREGDEPEILSGVFEGRTTGTALAILVRNEDHRSRDYDELAGLYRPGHADYTYEAKFGCRDHRGGGRASARETVARVAAGAVARKLLAELFGVRIVAWVSRIGHLASADLDPTAVTREQVDRTPVRCPDVQAAAAMIELVETVRRERDSVGGVATVVATGVPAGWGEPVFDKLKADLAKGLMSIPAVVGVEYGSGFEAARLRGSEHNDPFLPPDEANPRIHTEGNRHGGTLGGISSGMPIVFRCAVKPTSSIPRPQATVDRQGRPTSVVTTGRHDPCLLPRFVPIAEAMVALVLADHALRHRARRLDGLGAGWMEDP